MQQLTCKRCCIVDWKPDSVGGGLQLDRVEEVVLDVGDAFDGHPPVEELAPNPAASHHSDDTGWNSSERKQTFL